MPEVSRRFFLGGLLAAPAIIKTPGLLMPIRPVLLTKTEDQFQEIQWTLEGYGPMAGLPGWSVAKVSKTMIRFDGTSVRLTMECHGKGLPRNAHPKELWHEYSRQRRLAA